MGKVWRVVLYIVFGMIAFGLVLLGAAWITGASIFRIEELVLGGKGGLSVWFQTGVDRVLTFLTDARDLVMSLI